MSDIIHLLPDSVANQIAAGEVVQRPASVVKELLENSIDSGATKIQLIVKDAGKTLIQVIDNGCGMSDTDARMCFERHATSKIKDANDLFAIRTMGFRGEALASIAAISHVELKTKLHNVTLGTKINIEGSKVIGQEPCQFSNGTSISVKNLFFNVPARRNFLKSDTIETNHILEEFFRVAIINYSIAFTYHHNDKLVYNIESGNFRQRLVALFGKNYNEKLLPIEQNTNIASFYGFIGKPEFAKKTRGEQYFFVNKRFFKHPYLHHAVENAFQELIPEKSIPSYFINIETDPKFIDINIHPTKTEIKFQDEKTMYALLRSTVKQSLGKFTLTPTIDFDIEHSLNLSPPPKDYQIKPPEIKINPDFNPFDPKYKSVFKNQSFDKRQESNRQNWEKIYNVSVEQNKTADFNKKDEISDIFIESDKQQVKYQFFQINDKFIITSIKSGLIVIDQQRAYERIFYEKFIEQLDNNKGYSQQQLFPQTIVFSSQDAVIVSEIKDELKSIGYDIEEFGKDTFIINGIPSELSSENIKDAIEGMLENYKKNFADLQIDKKINVALSMARNIASKYLRKLEQEEIQLLIDKLFACKIPEQSPSGKRVYILIDNNTLLEKFK
jgi:DNA mismatch repair protein MutL